MGKNAEIFIKDELLDNQKFLFNEIKIRQDNCNIKDYDLFIATDTPSLLRLGEYAYTFETNLKTIIIDHHKADGIGKYNYIDEESSSCCEIIFKLIKLLKIQIDKQIATYLYAGLSADSGSFKNSNTNANSFLTAHDLVLLGADLIKVNDILYNSSTIKEIELERYLLNNYKIKNKIGYITIDLKTLKLMNATKEDCQHFSRKLFSIYGVEQSFSLIEKAKGIYSVSLRGSTDKEVRTAAIKLGGGGHLGAAGATIEAANMTEAKKLVFNALSD